MNYWVDTSSNDSVYSVKLEINCVNCTVLMSIEQYINYVSTATFFDALLFCFCIDIFCVIGGLSYPGCKLNPNSKF